jgi:hypothetical protein
VIKYLRLLEKEGFIQKKARRTKTGRQTSNQYDILRFWEIAKQVVRDALTAGKTPPEVPIDPSVPSIDEAIRAREHEIIEPSSPTPAAEAATARQAACSHPAHARRQPVATFAFCGNCYIDLPVVQE